MKTLTLIIIFAVSLTTIGVTPGPKRFDGAWWTTADSQEQQGFIVGFIDNEAHGYLDGGYWNQSSDKERLGFLEGYIQCYEQYMRRPRVRFSRSVEEYSDLLTKYFEDPKVDHENEKIAYVLHRFAARIAEALPQNSHRSLGTTVGAALRGRPFHNHACGS